jgi:hypothetical protein
MKIIPNSKTARAIISGIFLFSFAKWLDLDMPDPATAFFCIKEPGFEIKNGHGITIGSEILWCGIIGSSPYNTIYIKRWGIEKIILMYYENGGEAPDIKFLSGNRISISIPNIYEILSKTDRWLGYSFEYHIDKVPRPTLDIPPNNTGTNKPVGDQ